MDNELGDIVNEMEKITDEEEISGVSDSMDLELASVKASAMLYLTSMQSYEAQLKDFQQLLLLQKQIRHSVHRDKNVYSVMGEYIKNKDQINSFLISDIPRKIYEASFRFQEKVNAFLEQEIVMTFVYDGAEGPELYRIRSEDLLSYDYSSGGKLSARYRVTQNMLSDTSVLEKLKTASEKMNFNEAGLKTTYREVLERYRISKTHNRRVVLWNIDDDWQGMTVSSEGDIQEAYAGFVLLNKSYPSFNDIMEIMVRDYMVNGVANVDNISGLLQGDVTMGQYEYGIKSAGASVLGLKQMRDLAELIMKDSFSKEKLLQHKDRLAQKGVRRNKMQQYVEEKYNDIIQDFTKDIAKEYKI